MKIIRILSVAAAAAGFLTLGACKSEPEYIPPPEPTTVPGSYIDDGK